MRRFLQITGVLLMNVLGGSAVTAQVGQRIDPATTALPRIQGIAPVSVNAHDFGAAGDAAHDDTAAIQSAIDTAARRGGVVHVPAGRYMISKPLVLPRTGPFPTKAVQLAGEAEFATVIHGLSNFPPGRGLIEWAPAFRDMGSNVIQGQKISNLTLVCPRGVKQVRAILTKPFTKLEKIDQVQREWLQLDLENIRIECCNDDNEVLIDLGIGCRYSSWRNITADPDPGSGKGYDTLLIRVPSRWGREEHVVSEDSVGLGYMYVSGLCPNVMRGGWCRTFEGRAFVTIFENCQDVGGRFGGGAIAFHFINSSQLTLRNLAAEPKGSLAYRFDRCANVVMENFTAGTPPKGLAGQDSVVLKGCRNVRLRGHLAESGSQSFSEFGIHALVMDADCYDCLAEGFDVTVLSGGTANQLAAAQISIDPSAKRCKASGTALQAWSPDGKGYREHYTIGSD